MKTIVKLIIFLLFYIGANSCIAQKSNVAKVGIPGAESGSGIVIGQFNNTIFVATAKHIVENSDNKSIIVSFSNLPTERFIADAHYKKHGEVDLVILEVEVAPKFLEKLEFTTLKIMNPDKIKVQDKVYSIGYPHGDESLDHTYSFIKKNEDISHFVALGDANRLVEGFSGGLTLNTNSNGAIGMNLDVSVIKGECLKMRTIFHFAKSLNIETNYLKTSFIEIPKSSQILAGLSIGAFTSAIVCRIQSNNKYRDYLAFGETLTATEFDDRFGASLGEVYDNANGLNRKSIISTWVGSVFLTGATFFFIKENFWKDKRGNSFSKIKIKPAIEDVLIDNSVGINICVNF